MKSLLQAFLVLVVFTVLTGLVYPLLTTTVAVICFPLQSQGSLVYANGRVTGSRLIGQSFSDRRNFWPRPSATNYGAMPSGGSNLNPLSSSLRAAIDERRDTFRLVNGLSALDTVPGDMLFASGSGLDPDISPDAARLQISRIAGERNFTNKQKLALHSLVERSIVSRQLGFLGSKRINVLQLNMALENLEREHTKQEN